MFTFERLTEIRDQEIGTKAFSKEYMCSPVWSEDAYFRKDEIYHLVDPGLKNLEGINEGVEVVAGLDIGKSRHPSFFTVFMHANGLILQVFQIWMDGWEYTKHVEFINALLNPLKIKRVYYDDTRSELESFAEQGIIRRGQWVPVKFTAPEKFKMAANFSKYVSSGVLRLQNNPRQLRSILSVNNNLEALETAEGHGDAFWAIALALSHKKSHPIALVGAGRIK